LNDGSNDLRTDYYTLGTDAAWSPYRDPYTDIFNLYGVNSNSTAEWFEDTWEWLYKSVNGANTIIDRSATASIDWTPAQRDEIVGEARLFRAWAYRHLTYLWGDVPLNLHESTGANIRTDWVRAPKDSVLLQMEQDLLFAEAHLPAVAADGRLSSAVASHYLAELYLEMGQPAKAEAEARKVTDSGNYKLVTQRYGVAATQPGTPFTDMFLNGNVARSQGNTEVLWSFNYAPNVPGGGGSMMRREWVNRYYTAKGVSVTADNGGRGIGRMAPTVWALKLYAPSDDRGSIYAIRKFYIYDDPANVPKGKAVGDTVHADSTTQKANDYLFMSTRKWDGPDALDVNGSLSERDEPYIRLAETYLLLAEAQFKQGDLTGAAATINLLRSRAHAPLVTASAVNMDLILDERARELMGEEQRRYTLLRTGTLIARARLYNPSVAPNIMPRDTLFPIPQAVIDANIGHPMPQNPGF
jgi:starch-binding outer membrane protein, SusD/RagB family